LLRSATAVSRHDVDVAEVAEPSPPTDVSVEYELTQAELEPILRWQVLHNRANYKKILLPGVLFLFLGVVMAIFPQVRPQGVACLLAGAFFLGWFRLMIVWTPTSSWRKAKGLHQLLKVTVDQQGVSIRTKQSTTTRGWDTYSDLLENAGILMLKLRGRKAFLYVPKRAFTSAINEAAFRDVAQGFLTRQSARSSRPADAASSRWKLSSNLH
jgi:hypothetical protein